MVIQKEIMEGERAGWYTRLVDGILKPQDAVDKGILDVAGGESLVLTLSYYVLDDAVLEAFESSGYLIVPDGRNNGTIVDPIWLNMWKPGFAPGDNSMSGGQSGDSGDGDGSGGCTSGGAVSLALIALAGSAALLKRRR
jgi:hypothetical protein